MSLNFTLEVCVESVESAIAAERGGAHRIELCSNLANGGTTPSAGLIAAVRQAIRIPLHVMIRPRASDFCYTEYEFQAMRRDILMAKQLRCDAIVFGVLDPNGNVDAHHTQQLVGLSAPLPVTFHRAFDMSADLFASLNALQDTGVSRVLSSGGKQTAIEGAETLHALVRAASKLTIIAGSGVDDRNVVDLVRRTGVHEIHASLRSAIASPMRFKNESISMGSETGREYDRFEVQQQTVENLLRAATDADL
jgi:copper homeostasis protein